MYCLMLFNFIIKNDVQFKIIFKKIHTRQGINQLVRIIRTTIASRVRSATRCKMPKKRGQRIFPVGMMEKRLLISGLLSSYSKHEELSMDLSSKSLLINSTKLIDRLEKSILNTDFFLYPYTKFIIHLSLSYTLLSTWIMLLIHV